MTPRRETVAAIVAVTAFGLMPEIAHAQSWTAAFFQFVHGQQRAFIHELMSAVRSLRETGSASALIALVGWGFGYGVFHAVGPGHGKAVISAYALTHKTRVKRTLALAFGASMVQGLTAIAIVGGMLLLLQGSLRRAAMSVDDVMEPVSYAAVLCVGLYLLFHGVRGLVRSRNARARDHAHDRTHIPNPNEIERAAGWRQAALIALSVGVRPCSGAVLLLILAFGFGLVAGGIAAVSAMSLGTGITVAILALTAQGARWPLARILTRVGLRAGPVAAGLGMVGGAAIAALAALLLYATLTAPAHPFR